MKSHVVSASFAHVLGLGILILAAATQASALGSSRSLAVLAREPADEEQRVIDATTRFFDAIGTRDADTLEEILLPSGSLFYQTKKDDGNWELKHQSNAEWLSNFRTWKSRAKELTSHSRAQLLGPIATVTQNFIFIVDDRVRHCGINSIQLVKSEGQWRIANIVWTAERTRCQPK